MDLSLYNFLTEHLAEPPNLSIVQEKLPIPEDWPVILSDIEIFRKQIQGFSVSDGSHQVFCISKLPELYNKVATLEVGTIIHLIGTQTLYDDVRKSYIVDVHDIFTLKEYDELLKERQRAEEERLAWLREQDYMGSYDGEPYSG
jgi:hypothetical protein